MNDESSSSAQPAANLASSAQDATPAASGSGPSAVSVAEQRNKNRLSLNRKRTEMLDELLRNLDILVYAELSTIYYLDCSFLKFFLRALVQLLFLTPKPAIFPAPPPNRPYLGVIFGGNTLAIVLHLWNASPSAGEATHGYLHGGLAMDFIGQRGPTSKVYLILLDLLVAIFQLVQLSTFFTKQRLREKSDVPVASGQTRPVPTTSQDARQDLDSEERGLNRVQEQQDIEMQSLNPTAPAGSQALGNDDDDEDDRSSLLAAGGLRTDTYLRDAFYSGQIVLADLNLVKTVQQQLAEDHVEVSDPAAYQRMRANVFRQLLSWRSSATPTNVDPT